MWEIELQPYQSAGDCLKAELGRAISLIPGKSESSLMIQFSDCRRLWFGGENEGPFAFVNVMVLGSATENSILILLTRLSPCLKELQIKRIYVKFEEVPKLVLGLIVRARILLMQCAFFASR